MQTAADPWKAETRLTQRQQIVKNRSNLTADQKNVRAMCYRWSGFNPSSGEQLFLWHCLFKRNVMSEIKQNKFKDSVQLVQYCKTFCICLKNSQPENSKKCYVYHPSTLYSIAPAAKFNFPKKPQGPKKIIFLNILNSLPLTSKTVQCSGRV